MLAAEGSSSPPTQSHEDDWDKRIDSAATILADEPDSAAARAVAGGAAVTASLGEVSLDVPSEPHSALTMSFCKGGTCVTGQLVRGKTIVPGAGRLQMPVPWERRWLSSGGLYGSVAGRGSGSRRPAQGTGSREPGQWRRGPAARGGSVGAAG